MKGSWRVSVSPQLHCETVVLTPAGLARVPAYTYLWEFIVEAEQVGEFERRYGPQGPWVELFRQAPGYIQTLLLRDSTDSLRFVTIDRWESAEAYLRFRSVYAAQYAELDLRCKKLTTRETLLGNFDESTV